MMDEDPHFEDRSVVIFGLGLMGGSLAMAIRDHCRSLYGIDPDPNSLQIAEKTGIFDKLDDHPSDQLDQYDFIILAAPVMSIIRIIQDLPKLHSGEAVVIDLGSTKNEILQVMHELPSRFDPVGGHPMCGKERGTLTNASSDLYRDSPFVLSPLKRTTENAKKIALEMVEIIGAKALWLDPVTHDQWVAGTSHLPFLISSALSAVIPIEYAPLVGTGYRSTTRLALSSPRMMTDILITNQGNILGFLEKFRQSLDKFEQLLQQNDSNGIFELIFHNASHQEQLLNSIGESF